MKASFASTVFICMIATSIPAQQKYPQCTEVKCLDFFGVRNVEVSWPESEIEGLLKSEHTRPVIGTDFLVPIVVKQIAAFRAACASREDKARFDKLVALYLRIRKIAPVELQSLSQHEQIAFIIRDFYSQVEEDLLLPHMLAGFDDRPLNGKSIKAMPKGANPQILKAKFGDIRIANRENRVYVGAFDANGRNLWVRQLTGAHPSRYLNSFDPAKVSLTEFEAASVLELIVDGERLSLYTRPNGKFIFYSLSW